MYVRNTYLVKLTMYDVSVCALGHLLQGDRANVGECENVMQVESGTVSMLRSTVLQERLGHQCALAKVAGCSVVTWYVE